MLDNVHGLKFMLQTKQLKLLIYERCALCAYKINKTADRFGRQCWLASNKIFAFLQVGNVWMRIEMRVTYAICYKHFYPSEYRSFLFLKINQI